MSNLKRTLKGVAYFLSVILPVIDIIRGIRKGYAQAEKEEIEHRKWKEQQEYMQQKREILKGEK